MNKVLNTVSTAIILVAMAMMFYVGYLMFWPLKVIEYLDGNFITCKAEYKQGEALCYRLHYNKHLPLQAETVFYFKDGIMFQMPSGYANNPVGIQDFIKIAFVIPDALPPGEYTLVEYVTYKANPLRMVTYRLESNRFKIVKK